MVSAQAERKPGVFFHLELALYVGSSAPNAFTSSLLLLLFVFPAFCPAAVLYESHLDLRLHVLNVLTVLYCL